MKYDNYKFLWPPRAEAMIRPAEIEKYDNGEYCGQPKLDGSAIVVAIRDEVIIRNRHNEVKSRVDKAINFPGLRVCDGWMVLCGELLDKSKRDEHGRVLKGFCIWDVMVYDGKHLEGSTLEERISLLENLWPANRMRVTDKGIQEYNHLCFTGVDGVFKVPTYLNGFADLYKDLIQTQLYEGLVLKKLAGKLELGLGERNNSGWQLKVRKKTRNYSF